MTPERGRLRSQIAWVVVVLPPVAAVWVVACVASRHDRQIGAMVATCVGILTTAWVAAAAIRRLSERSRASRRLAQVTLAISYVFLVSMALVGLIVRGDPAAQRFLLGASLDESLSACETPFRRTDSCRREDRSWIECQFAYRAEGEPDRGLCTRFPIARGTLASPGRCNFDGRGHWVPVRCERYGVGLARCFLCTDDEAEAHEQFFEGFDAACARSIVIRTCNDDLRRAAFELKPN